MTLLPGVAYREQTHEHTKSSPLLLYILWVIGETQCRMLPPPPASAVVATTDRGDGTEARGGGSTRGYTATLEGCSASEAYSILAATLQSPEPDPGKDPEILNAGEGNHLGNERTKRLGAPSDDDHLHLQETSIETRLQCPF